MKNGPTGSNPSILRLPVPVPVPVPEKMQRRSLALVASKSNHPATKQSLSWTTSSVSISGTGTGTFTGERRRPIQGYCLVASAEGRSSRPLASCPCRALCSFPGARSGASMNSSDWWRKYVS